MQKNIDHALDWTAENGFVSIDLPPTYNSEIGKLSSRGLAPCSIDLAGWGGY